MRRPFLGVGDRAGEAVVTEGLSNVTHSGVHLATLHMKTWCNACKQEGYIAPRGPRHQATAPNGQRWALSGDINICGCSPSPVFHAERSRVMIIENDETSTTLDTNAIDLNVNRQPDSFDQRFRLIDARTGEPLVGILYRINTADGKKHEGRTDTSGHTLRVSNDHDMPATLHVLEDVTPTNSEWDANP